VVAGKPEPPLHAEAVARTGARHPLVSGTAWTPTSRRGPGRRAQPAVFTGVTRLEESCWRGRTGAHYLAADLAGLLAPPAHRG